MVCVYLYVCAQRNLNVRECWKSVYICQSYDQKFLVFRHNVLSCQTINSLRKQKRDGIPLVVVHASAGDVVALPNAC